MISEKMGVLFDPITGLDCQEILLLKTVSLLSQLQVAEV